MTEMGQYYPDVMPDADGTHTCWICLDAVDEASVPREALRPCVCATYVHRACLDGWRYSTHSASACEACPNCRQMYDFEEPEVPQPSKAGACCSITGRVVVHLLAVWIPTLIILGVLMSCVAPLIFLMDSGPRNIPVAMRFIKAHVLGYDETDAYNGTSGYIDHLQERYRSHPSITWDQYFLFAGMLVSPIVLYIVHLTMRRERHMREEERTNRSAPARGRRGYHSGYSTGYYTDDFWFWYWMWNYPAPMNTRGTYSSNSTCCDDGCCDCGNCGCNCGNCDCDSKGGDGGEAMVIVCVVLIALLAVIVLTAWVYLFGSTVVQSVRTARAYADKAREETLFRGGVRRVKHHNAGTHTGQAPPASAPRFSDIEQPPMGVHIDDKSGVTPKHDYSHLA